MSENEVPDEERLQQLQYDIDSARKSAEDAELLVDSDEREIHEGGDDSGDGDESGDDTGERESDGSDGDGDDGDDGDETGEREFRESGEEGKELDDQTIAPPG